MTRLTFRRIKLADIEEHRALAHREGLTFSERVDLFGAFDGERLIGFGGLLWYPNKVISKNDFIIPEYRGRGLFIQLLDYKIKAVRYAGIKKVFANCTASSLPSYLKLGARVVKRMKSTTTVEINPDFIGYLLAGDARTG